MAAVALRNQLPAGICLLALPRSGSWAEDAVGLGVVCVAGAGGQVRSHWDTEEACARRRR